MPDIEHPALDAVAWVTKSYFDLQPEERLLLIAESFYDREKSLVNAKNPSSLLIRTILEGTRKGHWKAYFTRLRRWVANYPTQPIDEKQAIKTFWNTVVFYHYVQTPVGDSPRQRPDPEQWSSGVPLFKMVVNESAPSRVIFIGKELWQHARDSGLVSEKSDLQGSVNNASPSLPAMATHHPSAFATKREWAKEIRAFLGADFTNTFSIKDERQ